MRCSSLLMLASALGLAGCVATIEGGAPAREASLALPAAHGSELGRLFAGGDGSESRFAVLDHGDDGFDARLALASAAQSAIDCQSYLWHEDSSGGLLLERLLEAADRGARVRLLVDGFQLEDAPGLEAALSEHPRFEVRLFNPTVHRGGPWRALEVVENLGRLDHRMHDKLFLVDGVAGVFGGRNVGDEYFGLGEAFDFRDFDLFATGPIVPELQRSFDEFWNSEWSVALPRRAHAAPSARHARARDTVSSLHAADPRLDARRALGHDAWIGALERLRARLVAGRAEVLRDPPDVTVPGDTGVMARAFEAALDQAAGDVVLVTAYLVPDPELLRAIARHVERGGRVRLLTNSLLTTNQPLAHTFYARQRHALLRTGAELHELRPDAWSWPQHRSPGSTGRFLGLHAKSAVFGDDLVVVGSMNLDPRSMELNTEIGVLIESPALAREVRTCLERELAPRNAWRVTLEPDGGLAWTSGRERLRAEPGPCLLARLFEVLAGWLPLGGEI